MSVSSARLNNFKGHHTFDVMSPRLEETNRPSNIKGHHAFDVMSPRSEGTNRSSNSQTHFFGLNSHQLSKAPPWEPWTPPRLRNRFRVTNEMNKELPMPTPVKNKDRGKQGIFSLQESTRASSLIKSLLMLGLTDEARKKALSISEKNIELDPEVVNLLDQRPKENQSWRSPWKPLVLDRGTTRYERSILLEDLREWNMKENKIHTDAKTFAERETNFMQTSLAMKELHETMEKVSMWTIMVHVPWKKKTLTVNVDNEFTVDMVKNEIKNLEGIHPDVQRLFLLPRVSQQAHQKNKEVSGLNSIPNTPSTPKLKPLGAVSARRLKMKEMSPRGIALQRSFGRSLVGELVQEDPLFLGQELVELTNDDAFIIALGIGPHDMIEIDVDEEASRKLRSKVFHEVFGGNLRGWKFDNALKQAFTRTDLDCSGLLDKEEVRMAFENMDIYLTWTQVDELVNEFDQDGDRRFDFNEFRDMVKLLIGKSND